MRAMWPITLSGVDRGARMVKAVALKVGLGGPQIRHMIRAQVNPDQPAQTVDQVAEVTKRAQIVSAGLSGDLAYHRLLELPNLPGEKQRRAASFDLEDRLPVSMDLPAVDIIRLNSSDRSSTRCLAFGVDAEVVDDHLTEFAEGGIRPQVISLDTIGLLRAATEAQVADAVVVDVGATKTTVICMSGQIPVAIGYVKMAGDAFDYHLSHKRSISIGEAIAVKETLSSPRETAEAMAEVINLLAGRIGQIIKAAYATQPIGPDKLYLSGGSLWMPGFGVMLAARLNLTGELLEPLGQSIDPDMVSAVGLALSADEFDLSRDLKNNGPSKLWLRMAGVAAIVVLILTGANIYLKLTQQETAYQALKTTQLELVKNNLPHVNRIVSPIKQMKTELIKAEQELAALTSGRGQTRVLEALAAIQGLMKGRDIKLRDVIVAGPAIRLSGQVDSFEGAEEFRQAVETHGMFVRVELESSRTKKGGVQFKMRISR